MISPTCSHLFLETILLKYIYGMYFYTVSFKKITAQFMVHIYHIRALVHVCKSVHLPFQLKLNGPIYIVVSCKKHTYDIANNLI